MTDIIIGGADAFATAKSYSPGVTAGLRAALIGGVSASRATANLAAGQPAFTPTGTPVVDASSVTFGAQWVDTQVAETADLTWYCIAKPSATGRGSFLGNYTQVGPFGVCLIMESGGNLYSHCGVTDGTTKSKITAQSGFVYNAPSLADAPWVLLRLEVDSAARVIRMSDLTTPRHIVSPRWAVDQIRDISEPAPIRIGSGHYATFRAPQQIMAALIYDRLLTAGEQNMVESKLRALASYHGVAI